jgi:uracil phosphoribosyltransferase
VKIFLLIICLSSSLMAFGNTQALDQLVYEIRLPETNLAEFRQAVEKIGEYLALNVLEELSKKEVTIQTLLEEEALHSVVDETPVLVTILRAGLPLNAGVQKVFPNAEVGFLGMARDKDTLKAKVDYVSLPDLRGKSVIVSDTAVATGGSLLDAIQIIEQYEPKQIFVITALTCNQGIQRVLQHNPNIKIFAAAVDSSLNEKGYIIPGLGDAGDRSYGEKYISNLTVASLKEDLCQYQK